MASNRKQAHRLFVLQPSGSHTGAISLTEGELSGLGEVSEIRVFAAGEIPQSPALKRIALDALELMATAKGLGVDLRARIEYPSTADAPLVRFTDGQDELYAALKIYEGLTPDQLEDVVHQELFEILSMQVLKFRAWSMLHRGVRLTSGDIHPLKESARA